MRNKKLITSSILMATLLGTGIVASSIHDANQITGTNKPVALLDGEVDPKALKETQGVYQNWVTYGNPIKTSGGVLKFAGAHVNYKLETDASGNRKYIVGVIFDSFSDTSWSETYNRDLALQRFVESPDQVKLTFYDLDKMPDSGWTESGANSADSWTGPYTTVSLDDDLPLSRLILPTTEAEWPFDLNSTDFGASTFNTWQNIAYEIPLTSEEYDHLYGEKTGGGDADALYQRGADSLKGQYFTEEMHTDSNFVIHSIQFIPNDRSIPESTSSLVNPYIYAVENTSNPDAAKFTNLSNRDKSLWLKYPEPKIDIINGTKNEDGTYTINDGSFENGYPVNLSYDHSVTPEEYSLVHSIDYKLYGPSTKGETNTDTLWDHWHLTDQELTRQFRTSTTDPEALSDVFTLGTNTAAGEWFDGNSADNDINIAMVDTSYFNPGDPNFTDGTNSLDKYSTGYLFSTSDYRIEFSVDGETTPEGEANSFTWPADKMDVNVNLLTQDYLPSVPVITKFEAIDDPIHNADGTITNTFEYTIDTKVDAEFDGTNYYPTGLEYIKVRDMSGHDAIGPTAIDPSKMDPDTGIITDTITVENLPANQTDYPFRLCLYYGAGVGAGANQDVNGTKYYILQDTDNQVNVTTGNRGSVDYDASIAVVGDPASTTADIKITTTAKPTIGAEDSYSKWDGGWEGSFEYTDFTEGTITVVSDAPDDITDSDLSNWDQGESFQNVTSWDLNATQIEELNSTGTTTVPVTGLVPNEDYTFSVDLTYNGETKPAVAEGDDRWDATWEDSRNVVSNEISTHTSTDRPFQPQNIEMSYTFVPTFADDWSSNQRAFRSQVDIWMDVQDGNNGIYSATNVESVEFSFGNLNGAGSVFDSGTATVTEQMAIDKPYNPDTLNQGYWAGWEQDGDRLHVTLSIKNGESLSDTATAKINYAGGQIAVIDHSLNDGSVGEDIDASTSIPDRGNLEVDVSDPVEVSSTTDTITFQGTITERLSEKAAENAKLQWEQWAHNENFEITNVYDQNGDPLELVSQSVTLGAYDGATVDTDKVVATHDYEFTIGGLDANKQVDIQAEVSYNGTSKVADEGQFKDDVLLDDINATTTSTSDLVSGANGDTDTLGIIQPELTINTEPVILVDDTTRDLTAKGTISLTSVSKNDANGFVSSYSATDMQYVRIMNGTDEVFRYDVSDAERNENDIITIDWELNEDLLEAKTDYDLIIEANYADGKGGYDTHVYEQEAFHLVFNTGSRGDLEYTGINVNEKSNVAGPKLTLGYSIEYEGAAAHEYADFNLLPINKVVVNAQYMENKYYAGAGDNTPESYWYDLDEDLFVIDPYTYDGIEHDIVLGSEELISKLVRLPGAPVVPDPADDTNMVTNPDGSTQKGDGIHDKAYMYRFSVSVYADYPNGDEVLTSDWVEYTQFSFLKGGFAPIIRDLTMSDIVVTDGENPTGSVSGDFWIEHRDENFYDGMLGSQYEDFDEIDMWESGVKSITLYDVTDPTRVITPTYDVTTDVNGDYTGGTGNVLDAGATEPLDQEIWNYTTDSSYPSFMDQPDSYNETPAASDRSDYDAWLAESHDTVHFELNDLTPNETYKFKLVVHYSGDNLSMDHTNVNAATGYDQVKDIEIAVPSAGFEEVLLDDIQFAGASSSLTTWTLSYSISNMEVDPRYDAWELEEVYILDPSTAAPSEDPELPDYEGDKLASSTDKGGKLTVEKLIPGINPMEQGWQLVVKTKDGQKVVIELNEDWARNTMTIEGNHIATEVDNGDGTFDRDWIGSDPAAIETWDINGEIIDSSSVRYTDVAETSFNIKLNKTEDYDNLVKQEYLDETSITVIDNATEESLNAVIANPVLGKSSSSELTINVTGLDDNTSYGKEGFSIEFNITDPYLPNPDPNGISLILVSTEPTDVHTIKIKSGLLWKILLVLAIVIPVVLIVLFLLWLFMLAWLKEKEVEFKADSVTFRVSRSFADNAEKLKGAKLTHSEGEVNYSIKEDKESGKILVTLTGIKPGEPLKKLKFVVDTKGADSSNERIQAANKELTATYEKDLSAWEAKMEKANAAISKLNEGKPTDEKEVTKWEGDLAKAKEAKATVAGEKPAKPALEKLVKVPRDISIIGSVKTKKPEPKPPKEEKPAAKPAAKAPAKEKKVDPLKGSAKKI